MNDTLFGVLLGAVGMGCVIYLGALITTFVKNRDSGREIQVRLDRALDTIRYNAAMLEEGADHISKVESDLRLMKQVCGQTIENTLVYFEQNPAIFGEKNRSQIVDELYSVLEYTGRSRTEPIGLLEHHVNGGSHGEQLS